MTMPGFYAPSSRPACVTCAVTPGEAHTRACGRRRTGPTFDPMIDPHEISKSCEGDHCAWHEVDEPAPDGGGYISCPECWHLYPTAGALRSAYRRKAFRIFWQDATGRSPFEVTPELRASSAAMGFPIPRFLKIRAALRIFTLVYPRASRIHFCQHCLHDFA